MDLQPIRREGDAVHFADGAFFDVFSIAREWGRWQESLHGDRCMVPECMNLATNNATLFGHHVGRLCDAHLWDVAARAD